MVWLVFVIAVLVMACVVFRRRRLKLKLGWQHCLKPGLTLMSIYQWPTRSRSHLKRRNLRHRRALEPRQPTRRPLHTALPRSLRVTAPRERSYHIMSCHSLSDVRVDNRNYMVIHFYGNPYEKWNIFVARPHLWLQLGMVKR